MHGDDFELILTLLALFGAFGGALMVLLRYFAKDDGESLSGKQ